MRGGSNRAALGTIAGAAPCLRSPMPRPSPPCTCGRLITRLNAEKPPTDAEANRVRQINDLEQQLGISSAAAAPAVAAPSAAGGRPAGHGAAGATPG